MRNARIVALGCLVVFVALFASNKTYGDVYFGKGERIKCIEPLKRAIPNTVDNGEIFRPVILDSTGKPFNPSTMLCYKYSIQYFILGVAIHDDGYVLAKGDDSYEYFPLDETKLRDLQADGTLPNPLPGYSLTWMQYAAGYSLWLLIAIVVLALLGWAGLKMMFGKLRNMKNRGVYCLGCNSQLTIKDFSDGKCEACSEPVPST